MRLVSAGMGWGSCPCSLGTHGASRRDGPGREGCQEVTAMAPCEEGGSFVLVTAHGAQLRARPFLVPLP